jgi:hypothetical protein
MAELPRIHVPRNLPELVKSAFGKAKAGGDLIYYPSQVAVLTPGFIPVMTVLRIRDREMTNVIPVPAPLLPSPGLEAKRTAEAKGPQCETIQPIREPCTSSSCCTASACAQFSSEQVRDCAGTFHLGD